MNFTYKYISFLAASLSLSNPSTAMMKDDEIIKKIMTMKIEVLKGERIAEAQKLSHEVFYKEKNIYTFSSFNPFNQKVVSSPIGELLVDDDDSETNTLWFGAIDDKSQLVGCSRLIGRRLKDNKLRCLELVTDVPEELTKVENLVEVGRVAIKHEYRYKGLLGLRIGMSGLLGSLSRKESIIAFTNQPNAYYLSKSFGYKDIEMSSKVYPDLKFLLLHYEDIPSTITSIDAIINYILKHKGEAKL